MSQPPPSPPPPPPSPPPITQASYQPPAAVAWPALPAFVRPSRPGIVTAIGVTSIVVACLSVMGNIYTAISLFVFSVIAPAANAMAGPWGGAGGGPFGPGGPMTATTQAAPAPPVRTADAVLVEAGGMDAADRRAVAEALSGLEFLSAARLEQLDALLAKSGRDIFPLRDAAATPGAITKLIQTHGTSPGVDPATTGATYFRTREGRVELYDDRAVFYPSGGAEIVRTSTLTASNAGLTPEQVKDVVEQAQAAAGNAMNPSQVAAVTNLVSTDGQQLVSPLTVPTAIRAATLNGDGSVVLTFPNGYATIGPQGQAVSNTGPNAVPPALGRARINGAAMALTSFATLAASGLAVYLFVIGILTLRQSPRGRKWHLTYAMLKIPVTILGAAAGWWLTASFMEASLATIGPGSAMAGGLSSSIGLQQVVFGVLGLIYPVVLLIVLQAKSVKDYFESGVMG